ncbi:MAG: T9SS type A sorting domain-containing protein [Bacteroidota bacterium]
MVSISPNPSEGTFIISSKTPIHWDQIEVYSLTGEVIKRGTQPDGVLDMREFPAGVYLVRLKSEHLEYFERIILR